MDDSRHGIFVYDHSHRDAVELFRTKTFSEGNQSLDHRKFDPDALQGRIWLAYDQGQLVSLSAAEVSHYTGEHDVLRKCRYHILRSHRHGRYGFQFLQRMVTWGAEQGFKLLYWTHDVNNAPLNALYQRRKRYAFSDDVSWFDQWPYTELQFQKDMLFKTGDMLQFVYAIYMDKSFAWRPSAGGHIYYYQHDGRPVAWSDICHLAVKAGDHAG